MNNRFPQIKEKIVCYCGSYKFIDTFRMLEEKTVHQGVIGLFPAFMARETNIAFNSYLSMEQFKKRADELHKRKIDICDEVFVVNVGGYIGESTGSEIEYARQIGKPIIYLESKEENDIVLFYRYEKLLNKYEELKFFNKELINKCTSIESQLNAARQSINEMEKYLLNTK